MSSIRRAFTLIELLVVIAIIAILAAILFPVFAQAKVAAKKAAALSNIKQQGTATAVYLSDSDDTYPLAFGNYRGTWLWQNWNDVPADWRYSDPEIVNAYGGSSLNSTQPYRKNYDMLALQGMASFKPYTTYPNTKWKNTGIAYNGLLMAYSATAVNAPSSLPMYTQMGGNLNAQGADTGPFPALGCPTANAACVYQPAAVNGTTYTCSSNPNGQYSYMFYPNASQWVYGQSQTWVYADTSAKSRKMGMNIGGKTDFHTDPYTNYKAGGIDNYTAWYDPGYCHLLIMRPDFDFATWPTNPYAGG